MATRGLIGYRLNDKDYVQYNHNSSGPDYLGKRLMIAPSLDTVELRKHVGQFICVDEDSKPLKAQLKLAHRWVMQDGETFEETYARLKEKKDLAWYELLRDYQGNLLVWEQGLKIWPDYNGYQWGFDCEWGYIFNLDTEKLEVYTGHWHMKGEGRDYYPERKPRGRYANEVRDGIRGILLVGEIDFETLRQSSRQAIQRYCESLESTY